MTNLNLHTSMFSVPSARPSLDAAISDETLIAAHEHNRKQRKYEEDVRAFSRLHLWPHPALFRKSEVLAGGEETPPALVAGMINVVNQSMFGRLPGIAIAANQVGSPLRVAIVPIEGMLTVMVNPVMIDHGTTTVYRREGCLSIPGYVTGVKRYTRIRVRYIDALGAGQQLELDDEDHFPATAKTPARSVLMRIGAQAVQHELDHLGGQCSVHPHTRQQKRQVERILEECRSHPSFLKTQNYLEELE